MTGDSRRKRANDGLMHLRSFAARLALVILLTGACDTQVPSASHGPTSAATGAPTSGATPAGQATQAPDPTPRAEGMRLLGSVPGSNADFAFWGDLAIVTNVVDWELQSADDGFVVIDISDAASPAVVGRFACAGSFQDVSFWNGLAVLSTDRITAGDTCGAKEALEFDAKAFAGLRIVSIEDPANPVLLASVPTGVGESAGVRAVRGSHTNTMVPDLEHGRLLVYASMYHYPGETPDATIVEIPLDDPAAARVIGALDNGVRDTCHDITVHLARRLAACSGYLGGLTLFDISDLEHPEIVSQLVDTRMALDGASWHSAVFSNDGRSMVVNAETFDGVCHGGSDSTVGALRFFDVEDPKRPELRSVFQLPRWPTSGACYAHLSGIVPMSGDRDVLVSGWMGGGVNLVEFTDLTNPRELAYLVAGDAAFGQSLTDAAYWYNGRIYAANLALAGMDSPGSRSGFEVFEVEDGILGETLPLLHLNPQTHEDLSPTLLARGSFVEHDWGEVDFEAMRVGSSVTGSMTIAARDGWGPIIVDLRCTRETEDGLVLIGGFITVGDQAWPAGTPAFVAIKRGSDDRANVRGGGPHQKPVPKTTGCLAYLDAWLQGTRVGVFADWIPNHVRPGGVEFGP